MRIKQVIAHNFGSYKSLDFCMDHQGLTLVSGPTGSGKSTFQDIVSWTLFGVTSKDGNADEVKSWTAQNEATIGTVILDNEITVTRIRGKSTQNDLYWTQNDSDVKHRSKDLTATQKLLEGFLGCTKDQFLTSVYYNEFSSTGNFFSARAKDRRELLEKIADLSLPLKITEGVANESKAAKKAIDNRERACSKIDGGIEHLHNSRDYAISHASNWDAAIAKKTKEIQIRSENFEKEKQSKIDAATTKRDAFETKKTKDIDTLILKAQSYSKTMESLKGICSSCGQLNQAHRKHELDLTKVMANLEATDNLQNPWAAELKASILLENTYIVPPAEENPFVRQTLEIENKLKELKIELAEENHHLVAENHHLVSLKQLSSLASDLRGVLLHKAIKHTQDKTNYYLEKYFDGEIRVVFILDQADNLEVSITKSGYDCVFSQLSKGQRCMLKLCFAVSVMQAAANQASTHFNCLFFDEALEGLDAELKVKAFGLLDELSLSHESIFVVEHSTELKSMFSKQYQVSMAGDESKMEEL